MPPKALIAIATLSLTTPLLSQDPSSELRRQIRRGNYAEAQALLSNPDTDPDAQDGRGFTALMFAVERDSPELVTLLVKAGADLDLQNNEGETALIVAVNRGRVDAARMLLMAGADVQLRDNQGKTALDCARDHGRTYLAQIITIASRPAVANVILQENPVTTGNEHLEPPRVVEEIPPLYTEGAFDRGIEGRVILRVIIRKDGSVGAIRVHQSLDSELDHAAIDAVESWKFAPATIDGDPINVLADIEVDFEIERS